MPNDWGRVLVEDLEVYLIAFFAVVGGIGIGYGIYLGIILATSEDEGKRSQVKSRIAMTVGGVIVITLLTVLFMSDTFRDGITGNMGGRDNAEWRLELNEGSTRFCRTCNEWQWRTGSNLDITLWRRPPHPQGGGFNPDAEARFTDNNSVIIQVLSWEPVTGGGAPVVGTHGRVTLSGGIDTSEMGTTGRRLTNSGAGVVQISIQFFESTHGSPARGTFQLAIPMLVVRVVPAFCTH